MSSETPLTAPEVALVDLLDRLLAGGVVLSGDLILAVAGIDLVQISLRALVTSLSRNVPLLPGERGEP